jgi:uncharacterized repeat protein (TIGR01451 family)
MKTWRIVLPLMCGLLMTAALLFYLGPQTQVNAKWLGNWYWKDGGWMDYAPSGVPDFDQKQANWGYIDPTGLMVWSYCGPAAAANSLWWFDSKFEPSPLVPPAPKDNYFLITSYLAGLDDHDPINVGGLGTPALVDDLAWYFNTDGKRVPMPGKTGTSIQDMSYGLQWWLYGGNPAWGGSPIGPRFGNYYDDYHVQMVKAPAWEWVVDEVERSEDVILLLGFWQQSGPEYFERLGGHYVTVAGINAADLEIAFSDPYFDNAESGGAGRVLSGTLPGYLHSPIPGHPSFIHNDAGNVSHDAYSVTLVGPLPPLPIPNRQWAWVISNYLYSPNFQGQNTPQEFFNIPGPPAPPIIVAVEYAIAVSPFTWKPGGEWIYQYYNNNWIWEWWAFDDDADSCIPDFHMSGVNPLNNKVYDAATALADSLWWFDSKAETLLTGDFADPPPPPPQNNDNYPLIQTYGAWDDHNPSNTQPLINDLAANYLSTDATGTSPANLATGIQDYLSATHTDTDFYTVTQEAPSFEWVASEVEACEDVVMLLGFYELLPSGTWERKGGHWVDAAGVSQASGQVGLSDPWLDGAAVESFFDVVHTGRVFPPERLGTGFTDPEKFEPQAISHDIYFTATSPVDTYLWALADYPAEDIIDMAEGLNGGGEDWIGEPISTVVEWAIGVSPYADLVITKTALVTEFMTTSPITFVIEYANTGLASVSNVVISDNLPSAALSNLGYTSLPPLTADPGPPYSWTIPKLSYGQGGVITVTAVVTKPLVTGLYTNTVTISIPASERSPANNTSQATFLVDVDPPETTIDSNPPHPTNSSSATFEFSGDDGQGSGVAGFMCKRDSEAWVACDAGSKTYTGLSEGSHTFGVYAIDNFGYPDPTPDEYTWLVDLTPPTTTIDTHPPDPSNSANADFTFHGADPGGSGVAGFECKLDLGAWAACNSGSKSYTGLSEVSHTFYVRAVDAAGNKGSPSAHFTWLVDLTAPTTTIDTRPPDPSDSNSADFTFHGDDGSGSGVAGYECKLDTGGWVACNSGSKTYTSLSEGSHTFYVRTVDKAGNKDGSPAEYTWVVDAIKETYLPLVIK